MGGLGSIVQHRGRSIVSIEPRQHNVQPAFQSKLTWLLSKRGRHGPTLVGLRENNEFKSQNSITPNWPDLCWQATLHTDVPRIIRQQGKVPKSSMSQIGSSTRVSFADPVTESDSEIGQHFWLPKSTWVPARQPTPFSSPASSVSNYHEIIRVRKNAPMTVESVQPNQQNEHLLRDAVRASVNVPVANGLQNLAVGPAVTERAKRWEERRAAYFPRHQQTGK